MITQSQQRNFSDYYKINKKEFIGDGQYGEVYKCEKLNDTNNDNKQYCVKIIAYSQKVNNQEVLINGMLRDYIQSNPQFINIVQTFDTFKNNNAIYIVMELCDEDLSSEFERMNQQNIWYSEYEVFDIIRQIITALKHFYNLNIIHRDIKPENILIKKVMIDGFPKKIYKIGDFGVGKIVEDSLNKSILTRTGTLIYAAPQMIFNEDCTGKCDIFSYGILFYQICFKGSEPYDWIPKGNLIQSLKQLKEKPFKTPPLNFSRAEVLQDLIEKMVVYEESKRASFEEIFNHPVMTVQRIEDTAIMSSYQQYDFDKSKYQENKKKKKIILDLYELKRLLEVLFNRFKICYYVIQQIDNNQQNWLLLYIIHLIAKYQLEYALAIIYIRPFEFHPLIQQDNDIINLVLKLRQVQMGLQIYKENQIQEFSNYQKQIQATFHKFNASFYQFQNKIQFNIINNGLQIEEKQSFLESIVRKVEISKLYSILRKIKNDQSATRMNDKNELLDQIINIETLYPINLYKVNIDLNEKFPIQIIQQYNNDSVNPI